MENKEKKGTEQNVNVNEEEISLDALSEVTGGSGLRHVKKEKTYDISDDIKSRI